MLSDLQFLPADVQQSLHDLLDSGVDPSKVTLLVDRILHAAEAKTTDLQMSIVRIEEQLNVRVDRIGDRLAADLRLQHGASNQMIVDIHTGMQQQGAAIHALRADFQAFGESALSEIADLKQRMDASERDRQNIHGAQREMDQRHGGQIADIAHELHTFVERLAAIEQLLEIAGDHDRREDDRREAGG